MVQEIYTCILADAFIQSDLRFRKYIFFYQYVHIVSYCWLHKVWFFRLQIQEEKNSTKKNLAESARKSPKCLAQPWTERELHG